jgi:hypothetical protein
MICAFAAIDVEEKIGIGSWPHSFSEIMIVRDPTTIAACRN